MFHSPLISKQIKINTKSLKIINTQKKCMNVNEEWKAANKGPLRMSSQAATHFDQTIINVLSTIKK